MDPDEASFDSPSPVAPGGMEAPRPNRPKLAQDKRDEIVRRSAGGEKHAALAAEYGVTRQAVDLMVRKARELAESGGWGRNLSADEQQRLKDDLAKTRPAHHGLAMLGPGFSRFWTPMRAHARAEQMFGRKLKKLTLMKMFKAWNLPQPVYVPPSPELMTPDIDESELEPEVLADAEFMAYIRSPIARQIREREIANWRREHAKRQAGFGEPQRKRGRPRLVREAEAEADAGDDLEPGPPHSPEALPPLRPGQRFGKHKASRGNPFTQKKQKKKKKKHRR